jgi:hypothetical protein
MRENRWGGDFDWNTNYYGPERTMQHSGSAPINQTYNEIAKRTIGRWAGDRVTLVGDYSEDGDLPSYPEFGNVYSESGSWTDITADVAAVIEHEVGGTFSRDGWKTFTRRSAA